MEWNCHLPTFTLRTAKDVTQYDGEDEFIGLDGEVLVPEVDAQGEQVQ
ncbi:TPA: hypothetical protein MB363_003599 [Klebsiella quasipneumoniae subsp. similipneumoniae]|nr:hypothetical protein [Klebsiella quasipneumoniae subsp. similipneumoniae]